MGIYLNEADRQLKNDKNLSYNNFKGIYGRTGGFDEKTKLSNLSHQVSDSIKAKDNRTHKNPDRRNHTSRLTADAQAKRLIGEGISRNKINDAINRGREWAAEDRAELEELKKERLNRKRSIKEACEYILNMLDEEYYED